MIVWMIASAFILSILLVIVSCVSHLNYLDSIREEGRQAGFAGKSSVWNPYYEDSDSDYSSHDAWMEGWEKGNNQRKDQK